MLMNQATGKGKKMAPLYTKIKIAEVNCYIYNNGQLQAELEWLIGSESVNCEQPFYLDDIPEDCMEEIVRLRKDRGIM